MENVTILDFLLCLGDLIWYLVGLFMELSFLMFTGSISRIAGFGLLARIIATVLLMGLILMIYFPFECPLNTQRLSDDPCSSYELLEWQLFHQIPLPTVGSTFSRLIGNKLDQEVTPGDKVMLYISTNRGVEQNQLKLQIKDGRIHKTQIININDDENHLSDDSELSNNLSGESEKFHSSQLDYFKSEEFQISPDFGGDLQNLKLESDIIDEGYMKELSDSSNSSRFSREKQIFESIPTAVDLARVSSAETIETVDGLVSNSAEVSHEHRSVNTLEVMKNNELEKLNSSQESSLTLQMSQEINSEQIEALISVINPDTLSTNTEEEETYSNQTDERSEKVEILLSTVDKIRTNFN